METKAMQLYLIGIRNIRDQNRKFIEKDEIRVQIKTLSCDCGEVVVANKGCFHKLNQTYDLEKSNCEINKLYNMQVSLPRNKKLTPFIDFRVFYNHQFRGFNSTNLYQILPKLKQKNEERGGYEEEQDSDSEETIVDIENLEKQISIIREKRKNDRKDNEPKIREKNDIPTPIELGVNEFQDEFREIEFKELLVLYQRTIEEGKKFQYVAHLQKERNRRQLVQKQRKKRQQQQKQNIKRISISKQKEKVILKQQQHQQQKLTNDIKKVPQQKIQSKKQVTKNQKVIKNKQQEMVQYCNLNRYRYSIKNIQEALPYQIKTQQNFSFQTSQQKLIKYQNVERGLQQEQKDQKQAQQKGEQYKFGQGVKLSLFDFEHPKREQDIQTYEDYNTDEQQNLDIIPQWYKGRRILLSDFEELILSNKKIKTIHLTSGLKIEEFIRQQNNAQKQIGSIKMIIMSQSSGKEQFYNRLLKPKQYYARIYILKGKTLISNYDVKPSTYLRFSYLNNVISLKDTTYKKEEYNPQYYTCHQIPITLPGSALVKIEVMQTHFILNKLSDKVLGYTQIDLQERYFMKKWYLFIKKPIELRNLYSEYGIGSQGRLQTWIDLVQKKQWLESPVEKIYPPPFDPFELRVIIWKTEDCVFKNTELESNDIFVRGSIGSTEWQETDTHWACRSIGNFNYRFKFPINYPSKPEDAYSDIFTIQIWDRDLVGFNNLIGQKRINLNSVHKIIQKAVKRKQPVKAKQKIKQKNLEITDRFYFDVFNHKEKNRFGNLEPQGRVQLSFELIPKEKCEGALKNGYGRSEPNVYPTLPEPVGRLQFNFLNPFQFIKDLLGHNLYNKFCCKLICCLVVTLLVFFSFYFLGAFIAVSI